MNGFFRVTLQVACIAAACTVSVGRVAAQPVTYALDPDHTRVHWEVRHFDTSTHRGRFDRIAGSIMIDRTARRGDISIIVDTASISSGNPVLDGVLRSDKFFAVATHPQAYLVATRLAFKGERLSNVRGEFTLQGVSKPLALEAIGFGCRHDNGGREICGGDFRAELRRSDHGITYGLPFVADRVVLVIQVEGVRL